MIEKIDIYRPDGSTLATITFDTESYRRWQVMGEHSVTLVFSLPQPDNDIHSGFIEIPVGSYITFKGHRYTLYNPSDFTKNGNRNYEYTLKLYAYQELTYDRIFINEPDMRQVFSRQARPEEFLTAIVRNMNHFDTGDWDGTDWTVGEYMTSNVQQLVQFNGISVAEALRLVADAFKTEWEINNKVISLRKVEYNKDAPLALSYGQGNGFKPGLGRGNFDQSRPMHKLYVTGGDRNIEFKTYGSQTLLLPKNTTIHFDGTYFEDETGYNSAVAREYQTSADGTNLVRVDVPQTSRREAFIELTEAYPKRIGTITNIVWIYDGTEYAEYDDAVSAAVAGGSDAGSVFCDVFDTSIPDDLNYASMRIPSEQMVFVPQTGRLYGVELSVQQGEKDASDGYIHSERRFKLITESDYGGFIPDGRLAVGDTYALFGMRMPQTYISIGERDLLKEAVRYKYENEELRFTFKGDMDGIWAQKNWDAIEDKIVAGGYVLFSDPQFQPDGKLIRISAIKEYLVEPYKPELELTNIVIGGGLRGELAEIPKQEVVINESIRNITNLSTRQWRDKEELRRGLARLHLGYSEGITPITVQAMQLVAGSEQLQFRFVDSKTTPAAVNPVIVYDPTANTLSVQAGIIQHMTLWIDSISATHDASEYKFWSVDALITGPLEEDKLYWLYARVPKTGNANGTFVVTTEEMPFDTDPAYYNLLVGALNSEYGGTRAFAPLYGFTEILPGRITTDRIVSQDGNTWFDLLQNEIAGRILFRDGLLSGLIGIGNDNGVNAGMSGIGGGTTGENLPTDVRIWAGENQEQRDVAPFRVLHDGTMYAKKGIFSGATWFPYVNVNNGDNLSPLNPNVILRQSELMSDIVYLPDITNNIIGCCFNLYWNGQGSKIMMSVQVVKSKSENILDFDTIKDDIGSPEYKSSINFDPFEFGFVQLICVDADTWVILQKNGDGLILE